MSSDEEVDEKKSEDLLEDFFIFTRMHNCKKKIFLKKMCYKCVLMFI